MDVPAQATLARVALISDWFFPRLGGVEWQVADLARALGTSGVQTDVLTTTPGDALAGVIRIPAMRAPRFGFAISPDLVSRVTELVREGRYSLVHAHVSVVSPLALAGVMAARRLNLPAVVTFHSMLLRGAGVLATADRIWGLSRLPVVFTAVSRVVAAQAQSALRDTQVLVLPNGINLIDWADRGPRQLVSGESVVIATAMRLGAKKRPLALVRAFQRACAQAQERGQSLELNIAGEGPERRQIERVTKIDGINAPVNLLGRIARDQLRALYARSDIFVMPSMRESFGLAALEARASGLPVVAMAGSGAEEFIVDGKTGRLARDDRELAEIMAQWAIQPDERAKFSGRDADLMRFDWPRVIDQHIEVYARAASLISQ